MELKTHVFEPLASLYKAHNVLKSTFMFELEKVIRGKRILLSNGFARLVGFPMERQTGIYLLQKETRVPQITRVLMWTTLRGSVFIGEI